jgi:FixJ family two-component response regulator
MSADQQIWILYIEDDSGQARLLQKRLARAGYTVRLAANGPEGIAFFDQQVFDILIVDYRIPGLSGLDVIKRLVEKGCLPPTVMVTGAGDERTAVEAMKLGASDYLVKDPDGVYLELLPVIIQRLLEQKRLADAKKEAENALLQSYAHLEQQVAKRTEELTQANQALESEILERKRAEELLREAHDNLEDLVAQRTGELVDKTVRLTELNVTLKVLLQKREEDKQVLQENIMHSVTGLILPCIDRLKQFNLSPAQQECLLTLENHIDGIISPFARKLSSAYFNLTPTEIKVAGMIKQNKTTKDIAEAFNISMSAIIFHRHNIRRKLGLRNKKTNLRTFLLTIE